MDLSPEPVLEFEPEAVSVSGPAMGLSETAPEEVSLLH
jgi:hypothetical protein